MMGFKDPPQEKLFCVNVSLDKRVRANHPLRQVARLIDFDFVYQEVKGSYGTNGHVSVPPPIILKLMLLLVFYNVRSERELMDTVPERLDWLWFLGYDLDSEIPDHSVLSKARKRWGVEVFQRFFERIVWQCVEVGLVDGRKVFLDSSLVEANASKNSVLDMQSLKARLSQHYAQLEARLEEIAEEHSAHPDYRQTNRRYRSTTDPDAALVKRGETTLSYQVHRAVDARSEVITATEVTAGDVNEAHRMEVLIEAHQANTHHPPEIVVADTKYGTIDNLLACADRGIQAHIPDVSATNAKRAQMADLFPAELFRYDAAEDCYWCPAGQRLKRKSLHWTRDSIDYGAPKKVCAACPLESQCTRNKSGRTVKRHLRQEDLDRLRAISRSPRARQDLKLRQHLMERSFARGQRLGMARMRWRRLGRVTIQEFLTAAIQNIAVLVRYVRGPHQAALAMQAVPSDPVIFIWRGRFDPIFGSETCS
ncbi:MAG: IS1182 family transposase [Terriglobia bacterium]